MIQSDAGHWPPPKLVRRFHRRVLELRDRLLRRVEIQNGSFRYRFHCASVRELNRCLKLLSKEPGTIEWIETEIKPGDVFYDIGANIGIFSIFAARHMEPGGKLYAFEPHAANFARLMENIACNELQGVVFPCNLPLHSTEGFGYFNYESILPGSSNSQFLDQDRTPRSMSELKYAVSVDRLIEAGHVAAPHHVKIDVDGNELEVLRGMSRLLESPDHPRSIQVELNDGLGEQVVAFLERVGYRLTRKHYTRSAVRRQAQTSIAPESGCNGVFHPNVR
jgi:FkbM family methyltransferase